MDNIIFRNKKAHINKKDEILIKENTCLENNEELPLLSTPSFSTDRISCPSFLLFLPFTKSSVSK
jgi:hypothetical protein